MHNTVWRIQPSSGVRQDRQGEIVNSKDTLIFEHVATSQYLSNDKIQYQNSYGNEMEVSCMNIATKSKTQILANENKGTQVRENTHKTVATQNSWSIHMASSAA